VKREGWTVTPPHVDPSQGYFFSADTIPELAGKIVNKYQRKPMPPDALENTVARYNSFVDARQDADFGKPAPKFKIQTPPFHAALGNARDPRHSLWPKDQCQVPGGGP